MIIVQQRAALTVHHLWESIVAKLGEWATATLTLGFGYTILVPAGLQTVSPAYAVFLAFVGPVVIAWALMIGGAGRLALLAVNGSWHSSPIPRAMAAACTSAFWLLMGFGFFLSAGFNSFGTWIYLVLAFVDYVNITRSMRDAAAIVYLKNGKLIRREDGTLVVPIAVS